ncbi:hypothetical protein ACFZB9_36205 [Kitasatospora sp. NPDC008050]|uniref:hypothetical protein n=1 Tax=Kitasatospora sp. NPDC008050 TaxID=3364021 RepID=UPI0036E4A8C3
MGVPGTELFEAIRRDHRAGDRLPSSLAARHHVSRATVMEALSTLLPLPLRLPADEDKLRDCRRSLDELLEEDETNAPAGCRPAFELYRDLDGPSDRYPVSYRWVWEYITRHRSEHTPDGSPQPEDPGVPAQPRSAGQAVRPPESADGRAVNSGVPHRTWAGSVPSDMPGFVTDLITGAVRQLAELKLEGALPAQAGVELGMVSLATAMARINQALYEFALVGCGSGLSYAQMSTWVGLPEDVLAQQVEDYHRLMTL